MNPYIEKILSVFKFKDLRSRILITAAILLLVRVLAHIPLPGVNLEVLRQFFAQNQVFGLLNLFSGGTFENFSIILMGVGPYITASIIMQLLTHVIPSLETLSKEGEYGQRRINQYTRILTVPLSAIQGYAMISVLSKQAGNLSIQIAGFDLLSAIVVVTAGCVFLMWLGEIISESGIGNGISLIITLGIIAGFPTGIRNTLALLTQGGVQSSLVFGLIGFVILTLAAVYLIVFITEAQRNIPVSYARRVRGQRMVGGVESYLPLRVNQAGVIPIIFAMAILIFPTTLFKFFQNVKSEWLSNAANWITNTLQNNWVYGVSYFVLVIAFTYFYTAIVFNPQQIAENLQKQGGFIPGIRPGSETIGYLKKILNRVTLWGAVFLAAIAVLPFVVQSVTGITTLVIGGTGILIIVSVLLETGRQIRAQLLIRTYDSY